ncbi:MAG: hypothetical protein PHD65_05430 [Gallionella sp.]|nr:hypothetical protein [Gallionella sp.]
MKSSVFFSGRQSAHSEMLRIKLSVICSGLLIVRVALNNLLHPFRQSARNCIKNSTDSLIKKENESCRLLKSSLFMYRQDLKRMVLFACVVQRNFRTWRIPSEHRGRDCRFDNLFRQVFLRQIFFYPPFCVAKFTYGYNDYGVFCCPVQIFRNGYTKILSHGENSFGFRPSGLDCSPAFDFLKMQTGGLSICIRPELLRPVTSAHSEKRMQLNRGINVTRFCFMRRLRLCRESRLHSTRLKIARSASTTIKRPRSDYARAVFFMDAMIHVLGAASQDECRYSECCKFRQKNTGVADKTPLTFAFKERAFSLPVEVPDYRQWQAAQMYKTTATRPLKTSGNGIHSMNSARGGRSWRGAPAARKGA